MSSLGGLRGRLFLQAAVTALYALAGRSASSAWTVPTLVVAVGAVFVALAMRQEPTWRWIVLGYEGFAVAYGLVALVSAHYVPGTIIAGYTLVFLVNEGAAAFAGPPSWTAPPVPLPVTPPAHVAPVAYAPPAPVAYAPPAPPAYPPPVPQAYAPPAPPAYPAPVPAAPAAQVPSAPPAPDVPVQVPSQPLAPRAAAMTILPGK